MFGSFNIAKFCMLLQAVCGVADPLSSYIEEQNEKKSCHLHLLKLSQLTMRILANRSFDGGEHTPKLLPCSHTVCLHCLTRIVASHARDDGTFRCPICREIIRIPSGGVAALPPSFLVNQLLDLMSRQRREVIPKCSSHSNQELLFCESCDLVFCLDCNSGSHQGNTASSHHTVIPLSIAIKRMSEILCYKANECYSKHNLI
ncbi:E3 ubiquitin-protein ligase TRIM56 [Armadillidium nasatum]|uniref:E3 ubiquitin-protein ligase TRIM56 n=1 Tax=Armadillidium nasatum TaxID=96803 RepID=A0A5N5TPX6_9CRUS|nr:E3 ubiquitin-protein ligase TRIM56 [Armadillidium nasatum]